MSAFPQAFLSPSSWIDSGNPLIARRASELAVGEKGDEAIARACYEFVRDSIAHSWDAGRGPVTCKASDALSHGTGFCYAKSHLLAALLRANGIPAGLCYERLLLEAPEGEKKARYCLHGLNAVFLEKHGWYRIDPRGNKLGVEAVFYPPEERLAFRIADPGEFSFPEIFAEPLPSVVETLIGYGTIARAYERLPDVEGEAWACLIKSLKIPHLTY